MKGTGGGHRLYPQPRWAVFEGLGDVGYADGLRAGEVSYSARNLEHRQPSYDIEKIFPHMATEAITKPCLVLMPKTPVRGGGGALPPVSDRHPRLPVQLRRIRL